MERIIVTVLVMSALVLILGGFYFSHPPPTGSGHGMWMLFIGCQILSALFIIGIGREVYRSYKK